MLSRHLPVQNNACDEILLYLRWNTVANTEIVMSDNVYKSHGIQPVLNVEVASQGRRRRIQKASAAVVKAFRHLNIRLKTSLSSKHGKQSSGYNKRLQKSWFSTRYWNREEYHEESQSSVESIENAALKCEH